MFDALLTICDDSLGIYEGGTPKGPGYLVKQQWLYRRMKLIAFARETDTYVDFRPGCFRFHVGWLPTDRFQGPGSYVIRLAVRDPEGRPSNTIVRVFKFASAGKP